MAQWITVLIFGGFGVMLLYVGVTQFVQQQRNMRDARPIDATVVHSQVVSHTSADTDSRLRRSTSTTTHRPDVRLRYQVLDTEYESDRLYPNIIVTSYASTESAAEALKPFPLHATVRAYVDPAHFSGASRAAIPSSSRASRSWWVVSSPRMCRSRRSSSPWES